MDLVSRIKGILTDPTAEWRRIEAEPADTGALLKNYVAILAAIPAVCGFIGASIIGVGPIRTPFVQGLVSAVGGYLLTFIGVFIMAFVIDALADKFGGKKNFMNAIKVAVVRADRGLARERLHRDPDPVGARRARALHVLSVLRRPSDPDEGAGGQDRSAICSRSLVCVDHRVGA